MYLNLSKFSGAHLNLSKFSNAPFFGGRRLLHNNFQVVLGGHVRLVRLVPSLRSSRLHRANRANKKAGRQNGAHGRARCRGRDSVYARWWDRVRTFVSFTAFISAAFLDARAGGDIPSFYFSASQWLSRRGHAWRCHHHALHYPLAVQDPGQRTRVMPRLRTSCTAGTWPRRCARLVERSGAGNCSCWRCHASGQAVSPDAPSSSERQGKLPDLLQRILLCSLLARRPCATLQISSAPLECKFQQRYAEIYTKHLNTSSYI